MGSNFDVDEDAEITSINVTPLVDVTLVLLIIFMVTTSVIANPEGIDLDKPDAATGAQMEQARVVLKCPADGTVYLDGEQMADDQAIRSAIVGKVQQDPGLQGIVVCDEQAPAGTMIHLIDLLRESGVKKYGVATEKPPADAPG